MIAHSGIGTYLRGAIPQLVEQRPAWTFSLIGSGRRLRSMINAPTVSVVECGAPIYGIREQIDLARLIPRATAVFWAPHYNIPLLRRTKLVVTVHDLAHMRLPEYRGVARAYARLLLRRVRRTASAVMFDSEFTRREFEELIGAPRGRGDIVHVGLSREWLHPSGDTPRTPIDGRYYVYVGNTKPHKNLSVLLDAFTELRRDTNSRLIVIGQTERLRTGDDSTVSRLRSTEGVSVFGEVSPDVLRAYLTHATALVLPSLYEGFGLPPLEAMAVGCPAIVSRAASLPEVCGAAALYFNPTDSRELATAMRRLATEGDLRETMTDRGRTWVKQYQASRTAQSILVALEHAAGN